MAFPVQAAVNILDFGADPADGESDQAALKAAVDALPLGGTIKFPAGIWNHHRYWWLTDNIRIECEPGAIFKGDYSQLIRSDGADNIQVEGCAFDVMGSMSDFLARINLYGGKGHDVRRNYFFDSQYPGRDNVPQRQYILVLNADEFTIAHNDLHHGGRIKAGRPGSRAYVYRNRLYDVNDNAITTVVMQDNNKSTDLWITENYIEGSHCTGLFVGTDGTSEEGQNITWARLHVLNNTIKGFWGCWAINVILPENGVAGRIAGNIIHYSEDGPVIPYGGIFVVRQDGVTLPTEDIVIDNNTVRAEPGLPAFRRGGVMLSGDHKGMRFTNNVVRPSTTNQRALWIHSGVHEDGYYADNQLYGFVWLNYNYHPSLINVMFLNNLVSAYKKWGGALALGTTGTVSGVFRGNRLINTADEGRGFHLYRDGTYTFHAYRNDCREVTSGCLRTDAGAVFQGIWKDNIGG